MPGLHQTWMDEYTDSGAGIGTAPASSAPSQVLAAVLASIAIVVTVKLLLLCTNNCLKRNRRLSDSASANSSESIKAETAGNEGAPGPLALSEQESAHNEQPGDNQGGKVDADLTMVSSLSTDLPRPAPDTGSDCVSSLVVAETEMGPDSSSSSANLPSHDTPDLADALPKPSTASAPNPSPLACAADNENPNTPLKATTSDPVGAASSDAVPVNIAAGSLPGPSLHGLSSSQPNVLEDTKMPMSSTGPSPSPFSRTFEPALRSSSTEPLDSPSTHPHRSQSFQAPKSSQKVVPRITGRRPRPVLSLSLNPIPTDSVTQSAKEIASLSKLSFPYTMDQLLEKDLAAVTNQLRQEFWSIPMNQAAKAVACSGPKNRYPTIFPNRESRVLLPAVNNDYNSTYINANFISGYESKEEQYIATQGPLSNTIGDFWRMVWHNKCEIIVMMSLMKENSKQKCDRYWPGVYTAEASEGGDCADDVGATATYDAYTLRVTKCKAHGSSFVFTEMELENSEVAGEVRTVNHYWFVSWPDQGVPESPKQLLDLVHLVKDQRRSERPVVIHCSAGIGRTGCFSAVDIGCQQLKNEGKVDIQKTVARLRKDRGGLVQTCDQYVFLFQCFQLYARGLRTSSSEDEQPAPSQERLEPKMTDV